MSPVNMTMDASGVNSALQRIQQRLKQADTACYLIATEIRNGILKATRSGVDYEGVQFKPYSAMYAAKREDNHRASTPVTLTYRNHMLASMTVTKIPRGAVISYNSELERKKARNHNEGITLPKRRFFDVSEKTRKAAVKRFELLLRSRG